MKLDVAKAEGHQQCMDAQNGDETHLYRAVCPTLHLCAGIDQCLDASRI